MRVNSEHLYNYINDLATDEKVKFKVYYDDNYVTEIYWNGECFEWDTGTFTSEVFFNPLYDFEVIEEDKKIEKLETYDIAGNIFLEDCCFKYIPIDKEKLTANEQVFVNKINEIIDKINEVE